MIVNHNKLKAGVLVIPCVKNGKVLKKIILLPGHNDVPDEDWILARESCLKKIKAGLIIECAKEVKVRPKKPIPQANAEGDEDLLTEKNFPYNDVLACMKDIDLYEPICDLAKEETGRRILAKKWLIEYFQEETADWLLVKKELLGDKESEEAGTIELVAEKLQEMDPQKAADIIADTYSMETLEKWKSEISQPDLRVLILNQMEEIQKPPKPSGGK